MTFTKAQVHADNRERVLTVARDLFGRQDYEAVTIRLIARCANLSTGAIFSNFTDKADLFRAAMGFDHERAAMLARPLYRALLEIMEQVDSLEGVEFTRDLEPHEAEACWEDAVRVASNTLMNAREAFTKPSPKTAPREGDGAETVAPSTVSATLPEGAMR